MTGLPLERNRPWRKRRFWCSRMLWRCWRLRLGTLVPEVTCGSAVMASLEWRRSLRRSRDLRKPWIDPEEYVTGVGLKVSLGTLSKVVQCLGLTLLEVCCHLLRTGLEVLLLDEELLHSIVCLCCFGQVYPSLKIVADPSNKLGWTFTCFWPGGSKPLAEAVSTQQ